MTSGIARLCIFWDYDTQWGGDQSRSGQGGLSFGPAEFANTQRLLELHAKYSVRACFAVVGAAAQPGAAPYYHNPDQIRRIHSLGHEVASHSMRHEWLPALAYADLLRTVRESKDAIEQCIGASVLSFVPPNNQPFDYPQRWAISVGERRSVRGQRTDIPAMCRALHEAGYRFARISYRPLSERLAALLPARRAYVPRTPQTIEGITCLRLSGPAGFAREACGLLERCTATGGYAVVYGHPHSLYASNAQNERRLVDLLARASELRARGDLEVVLPRDVVRKGG